MNTSRRSFLSGAGALVATTATGGGATAKAAMSAAAAGAGVAASAAQGKSVFETLKAMGLGFPDSGFAHITGWLDPDSGFGHIAGWLNNEEQIKAAQDRISGHGHWQRYNKQSGCHENFQGYGKVRVYGDTTMFRALRGLPRDVPILDVLSDETYADFLMSESQDMPSIGEVRKFRKILEPLCTEETTASDLLNSYKGFFLKLAQHAIENPDDFRCDGWCKVEGSPTGPDDISVLSELDEIERFLECFGGKSATVTDLKIQIKKLSEKQQHVERVRLYEETSKKWHKKQEQDRFERERLENNPNERSATKIVLCQAATQQFIIQKRGDGITVPTRMDWLQWLQTLDPENAKPADVQTDYMGMAVTIKNPVALEFLKNAAADTRGDLISVTLPNRRMGVDLNMKPQ